MKNSIFKIAFILYLIQNILSLTNGQEDNLEFPGL